MRILHRSCVVLSVVAVLALAGCKSGDEPEAGAGKSPTSSQSAAPDSPRHIAVKIAGDSVEPSGEQVEIGVGDTLELDVTSDRDGELHVHSSPEQSFDFGAGRNTFEVVLDKPGQVDIEEHVSDTLVLRVTVR